MNQFRVRMAIALILLSIGFNTHAQTRSDAEDALKGIEVFTRRQSATDPLYTKVENRLLTELDDILKNNPPSAWLSILRTRYAAISESEHAKERDALRESERRATTGRGTGQAAWDSRLAELEADAREGRIAPREFALRAVEAARIFFPGDDFFLSWRLAKVPIATQYEMGAITRDEYESRWQRITADFMDRQAARDRTDAKNATARARTEALLELQQEQLDAERQSSIWQGIGDSLRRSRGITCRPGPLGSMNCR